MAIVKGFLNRIQFYLDKEYILSQPKARNSLRYTQFVQGMFEIMDSSEECFILMVVYFDRLIRKHGQLINENNLIRLLFICGVVALKMHVDYAYKNSYFAKLSGISKSEINFLELDFLRWIDFNLLIQPEEYKKYQNSLIKH